MRRRLLPVLVGSLALMGCEPKGGSNPPEGAGDGQPADPTDGSLSETLGEASHCRTGRIELPEGGHLRAIKDDRNGYVVLLPDLADWEMACGDDPYLVAGAMGGAINATVTAVDAPQPLEAAEYLELFGDQLQKDLAEQSMTLSDKKVGRTDFDHWVLTFKVSTEVEDGEVWQFNYITTRAVSSTRFITLHMAVTARHNDSEQDAQIREFADGLVTYMDLFRVGGE